METITLENDINTFYITASSFPEGILEAHQKLHSIVPSAENRRYFGISRPEKGVITYKAAAEELFKGEAEKFKLDALVLQKGKYISSTIKDFTKDLSSIQSTFQKLLSHQGLDPQGYCVEWYLNDHDVQCMIRLKD